jgi:hypothetical protein
VPATLIHYHIYKNAGSSIDRLLRDSLGDAWTTFEDPTGGDIVDCNRLREFLAEHPNIRAVSSHRARPPLPTPSARPLVMLRHPIDRARSVFCFARLDRTQPDHAIARTGNFRRYVEHFLPRRDTGVVIRNYQVVHLSAASVRCDNIQLAHATASDLIQAKALLAEWRVFGLVRQFAESCRLFNAHYGGAFPQLRLYDIHENVSTDVTLSDMDALNLARDELGPATFERLMDANRLDLELYLFAQQLFAEHIRLVAGQPREGVPALPHTAAPAPRTP